MQIDLSQWEAEYLASLGHAVEQAKDAYERARQTFTAAFTMAVAARGHTDAVFLSLTGTALHIAEPPALPDAD